MRVVAFTAFVWVLVLCQSAMAGGKSVFKQSCANFDVGTKRIKYLKEGRELFTDRDFVLKMRPKELSSTRYILSSFGGSSVECSKSGVVFALALFDAHNQSQTRTVQTYLNENAWKEAEDVPPFVLYYTNGADRTGRLFWKKVLNGEKLKIPSGIVLCYQYRQK